MGTNFSIPAIIQEQIDHIAEVCAKRKPILVISCVTYSHETYLADALESFIRQKTNFPFVAIVHDDASPDKTAEILRQYAQKYPDIILPIYEKENQYAKKDGSLLRIMNAARNATGVKYIALCEGDDYWTDPNKLQKQVDFLESHPDYTLCFHNAIKQYECNNQEHIFANIEDREYGIVELAANWLIPTASMVFKSDIITSTLYQRVTNAQGFRAGDIRIYLTCATLGKVWGMNEIMSIYRILINGANRAWLKIDYIAEIKQWIAIKLCYKRPLKQYAQKRIGGLGVGAIYYLKLKDFKSSIEILKLSLKHSPLCTIQRYLKIPFEKMERILNNSLFHKG